MDVKESDSVCFTIHIVINYHLLYTMIMIIDRVEKSLLCTFQSTEFVSFNACKSFL